MLFVNIKIGIKFVCYYSNYIVTYELLEFKKNIVGIKEYIHNNDKALCYICDLNDVIQSKFYNLNNYTKNIIINNFNHKIFSSILDIFILIKLTFCLMNNINAINKTAKIPLIKIT